MPDPYPRPPGARPIPGPPGRPVIGNLLDLPRGRMLRTMADLALRLLPVTAADVEEMLGELRGHAVLDGVRGRAPVDRAAAVAAICRIAEVAWWLGDDLESLEVNPLHAGPEGAEALDALVDLRPRDRMAESEAL